MNFNKRLLNPCTPHDASHRLANRAVPLARSLAARVATGSAPARPLAGYEARLSRKR